MLFGLFYEGVFWDNLAHFSTSAALVALAVELAYLRGVLPTVSTRWALLAGAVAGVVGGGVWEGVEALANLLFPELIYNPPVDTVLDTAFGSLGGAVGAWGTIIYLGRKTIGSSWWRRP